MTAIRIPQQLADAVHEDDYPARCDWLAALPPNVRVEEELAARRPARTCALLSPAG